MNVDAKKPVADATVEGKAAWTAPILTREELETAEAASNVTGDGTSFS